MTLAVKARPNTSTLVDRTLFTVNVDEGYAYVYSLYHATGGLGLRAQTYDGSDSSAAINQVMSAGTWYDCAGVWASDSSRKVNFNGATATNTDVQNAASGLNSFVIGWSPWAGTSYWPGEMLAPAAWTRALSDAELQEYFENPWQIFLS